MVKQYKVGGHAYRIYFDDNLNNDSLLQSSIPFETEVDDTQNLIFELHVDDSFRPSEHGEEIGDFDSGGNHNWVFLRNDGSYEIRISDVRNRQCCLMDANHDFSYVRVALNGNKSMRTFGLGNALMMTYAFASAEKQTMLMHASVIRHQGKGYLMTAPSGTGKSTHTRLWYDNIPGCDLMNDDNPVVRIIDGEAIVYGSPWSGKTPCYRNIQAPVGGLVRIKQRPENSIRKYSAIEAFSNLLPAISNMKWDKRVYKGVCDGIAELIRLCGMYELGCLPDAAAAHLCHDTIVR
jgi:hypothetical protein